MKDRLRKCCLDSLAQLYVPEAGILAERLSWNGTAYERSAPGVLGTANVLLALYHLQSRGVPTPLDADRVLSRCVDEHLDRSGLAEIAVLLWADASGNKIHLARLWDELEQRLTRRESSTMLLSWALCAVCAYREAGGDRRSADAVAQGLHDRIVRNQVSRTGLFRVSDAREGRILRRRKPTAFLASQVFAIQALAVYSSTFGPASAADPAVRCADGLCALQGSLGQWWREYDVREGTVVRQYPVYSVNQDGAMPAALIHLGRAVQDRSFEEASERGVRWVFGANEPETSMLDEERSVILAGVGRDGDDVRVLREMYSYHPGRCLYALALGESG
jgi:hypothetical protein